MRKLVSPLLVGLLVLGAVVTLVFLVSISGRKGLGRRESYVLSMVFDDASGLASRSRVVIAGIDIGKLERTELEGNKARVLIRVSNEYKLYEDASVLKRSESLLGDSLLDITPGTATLRPLGDGDEIKNIRVALGMDQILASMQPIIADVKRITSQIADTLSGADTTGPLNDLIKQLKDISLQANRTVLETTRTVNRILANVEDLSKDLRGLTEGKESQINEILGNLQKISEDAKGVAASVSGIVGKQEGELTQTVASLRQTLGKLDEAIGSAQNVVKGVEQGEGMVGKVLRDPELAKKLDHTITEASAFADRLTGLKVEVGLRSEGHYKLGGTPAFNTKHTFGARLLPAKSSRYYGFDVVADTSGNLSRRVETVTGATTPSCAAPPCTVITDTLTDKFRVNAYLAQKWGPATFRIGMMESTGGVGVDLDIIENMLQVRADIFDFTEPANVNPHLRAMLRFSFLDNFDLYAGAGDVFNGPLEGPAGTVFTGRGRSVFLGAGFHFTDDDLKAILTTTGVPSF